MRNERFSTLEEIKRELGRGSGAGTVVGHINGETLIHRGEGHICIQGESGAGKTRGVTIESVISVLQNNESAVILDAKGGELYDQVKHMISSNYRVHLFDLRHIYSEECDHFNPLAEPYRLFKENTPEEISVSEQMVQDIAYIFYPVSKNIENAFWIDAARNLFSSSCYTIFELARDGLIPEDQVNLISVFYLVVLGEERYTSGTYLKNFVDTYSHKEYLMGLQSYVSCTATETRAGMRAEFTERMKITHSSALRNFYSHDDLHIAEELTGDCPALVFIILPDETKTMHIAATILISQLMRHFIRLAESVYHGKLPIRTSFIIEEMASLGSAIPNFDEFLSSVRSRNIVCTFCLQNTVQLKELYGDSAAQSILSNTRVRISFRVNNIETLDELSDLVGKKELVRDGYIHSHSLLLSSQLHALEDRQALVLIGKVKYVARFPDFSELPVSHYRAKEEYTPRKHAKRETPVYFNIVEYMNRRKAQTMESDFPFRPSFWNDVPMPSITVESETSPSVSSDKQEKPVKDRIPSKADDKKNSSPGNISDVDRMISDAINGENTDLDEMIRRIDAEIERLTREEEEAAKAAEKEAAQKAGQTVKRRRTRKCVSIMHPGDDIKSFRTILADYVAPDKLENAVRSCIFDTYTIRDLTRAQVDRLMSRLEKIHCLAVAHYNDEPF